MSTHTCLHTVYSQAIVKSAEGASRVMLATDPGRCGGAFTSSLHIVYSHLPFTLTFTLPICTHTRTFLHAVYSQAIVRSATPGGGRILLATDPERKGGVFTPSIHTIYSHRPCAQNIPSIHTCRSHRPCPQAIVRSAKGAGRILLATDPDREGEAIAWHVAELLREKGALREGVRAQNSSAVPGIYLRPLSRYRPPGPGIDHPVPE
jgi:hypothetical protein